MEIDNYDDPEESALFTTTSKMTQVLPPSNEEDTQSDKAPKPANKSVTCPTTHRRSGKTISLCVSSASRTNTYPKAGIAANTSVKSIKMEANSDVEEVTQVTSICTATTAKRTATPSQRTGTTSTSKTSVSNAKSTAESAAVCRTGAASRVTATSLNGAPPRKTESRVVQEANCKTAPSSKSENAPKFQHQLKTKATSQITSVTIAKKPRTSVKPENVETSAKAVHVRNSVGPNAPHCHKSNKPAAPHQATGTSVRPEHIKPPPEPSPTSMSKTKPSEGLPKVGLNELIVVSCEEKQQVYCKLCSVKLTNSSDYHLVTLDHWKKYVKTKYPDWTSKPSEMEKKLNEIAIPLAEAEKKLGPRKPQIVKVKKDEYEKLAYLPENEAVRHVKAISRRNLRVSSASPVDAASASPCDVSSSDDGINMQHDEMSELSINNYSAVENKNQHQTLLVQRQEEADLAASEPFRQQSSEDEDTQSDDLIQDEIQVEETAETDHFEEDVEVQIYAYSEVMPATESPETFLHPNLSEVFMEKPCILAEPPDTESDSDIFAESAGGDTSDHRPKRRKSEEGQNQLRSSQKMDHVPKSYPGPEEHSASQALLRNPTGGRSRASGSDSNLSIFLKTKGLDAEPVVGQGFVLECRGIALETFFLCTCCEKKLSHRDVCQHMVSSKHQFKYVQREYPQFLNKFWKDKDLPLEEKLELLKKVSQKLSEREQDLSPKVIMLRKEMHEHVRTAPFSEAVRMLQNMHTDKSKEMVQDIKSNHKHSVFVPQQNSQQPDERPIPTESLPTEMPSAHRLEIPEK